jgi:hypothetical protein
MSTTRTNVLTTRNLVMGTDKLTQFVLFLVVTILLFNDGCYLCYFCCCYFAREDITQGE